MSKLEQPVIRQLLAQGAARADALNLGLDVNADGALVDGKGRASSDIFAIGPITRGTFWEIVAVPDIRIACERLSQRLLPGNARGAERLPAHA